MVKAQAVIDALTEGEVVFDDSRTYRVLRQLGLLDMLPPWYEVEVYDEDGWGVMDDECPTLADAQESVRRNIEEDTEPDVPFLGSRRYDESPQQYAERVAQWAEAVENAVPGKPKRYRIREYRHGKRPRTVPLGKDHFDG